MNFKRRLRGIIGTALTWSVGFGVLALGISLLSLLFLKYGKPVPWRVYGGGVLVWSLWGLASGAIYGGLLLLLERKRTLRDLSAWRLAAWGLIAGAVSPLIAGMVALSSGATIVTWSTFAAVCASGSAIGLASAQLTLRAARGRFYLVPVPTPSSLPNGQDWSDPTGD